MAEFMDMRRIAEEVWIQDGYLNLKNCSLEKDVLYVLCPYGIGDTLYAASLVKSYKEIMGYKKYFSYWKKPKAALRIGMGG